MAMEIRQVASPAETKNFDTTQLRQNYLIEGLFRTGEINMTYSHLDRTVIGGAMPADTPIELQGCAQIGTEHFLDRRELGIINIGGAGRVSADGENFTLDATDCLYVPMGTRQVSFVSLTPADPAKFYLISTPAHRPCKIQKITADEANLVELGVQSDANVRTLRQYIHPEVCESCQLVMGVTTIEEGSVWNTMPAHIHDRRSEVYLYFDMRENTRVLHLMGEPDETRHIVVSNEQAVLSPGWSIHSGAGTGRYCFIWSMAGDNQDFTDMDFIDMQHLR